VLSPDESSFSQNLTRETGERHGGGLLCREPATVASSVRKVAGIEWVDLDGEVDLHDGVADGEDRRLIGNLRRVESGQLPEARHNGVCCVTLFKKDLSPC